MVEEIILRPVGIVKSELKEPSLTEDSGDLSKARIDEALRKRERKIRNLISEIIIDDKFDGILDGIEDFSHILVLYWAHETKGENRNLIKVHPMGRKDLPLVGVFATCSPVRPNPVLVTAVKLVERNGNVLKVQGFEAIDGSPVIDIKPYNPHYYLARNVKLSGWMKKIQREYARKQKL
ncbi:MAG: tRNA (N6-threonylcarbamoyladenosine(37)-N6)-methyltransferase TrmO [Deltaproteobacteria bacterium]|nr:MAG: tRNA (N6-threonylcarbamoyladenosine(37)-N6)-methyltransferase TrmO [Deltaproteobacteria bacterium]